MNDGQRKPDDQKFTIPAGRINARMDDDLKELAEVLNTSKSALIRDILAKGIIDLRKRYELDD